MTDLPAPPPEPYHEQETAREPRKTPLWPAIAVILAMVLVTGLAFNWLRPAPAERPTAAPASVAPRADVNPCAEDTFDANGCAVRMIEGAVKQTGVPPYTVVKIWCAKYATPKAQREIVDRWVSQGAPSREMARAVLDEILDYCPGMAKA